MRFFILMPLIPGLILWAVVSIMKHAADKGRQIQAEREQLLANTKHDIAFDQHFGSQPSKPLQSHRSSLFDLSLPPRIKS